MCPVWKKHKISNLRFLPIVKGALKVVMVVAIGNRNHNAEKIGGVGR